MKKTLFILILGITLCSCKKDLKNHVKADIEKSEIKQELLFSLYNSTEFELNNIKVGLPDRVLTYSLLEKKTQTEWTKIKSAYSYGIVRFYDKKNREYYVQPFDYVGEKLYKNGEMKFIIKEIDTIQQIFEFDSEFSNE